MTEVSAKRKKWPHTPYDQNDLPLIGLFFKELYTGQGNYGSMGLFHWKIVDHYVELGIINIIKDVERIASTTQSQT